MKKKHEDSGEKRSVFLMIVNSQLKKRGEGRERIDGIEALSLCLLNPYKAIVLQTQNLNQKVITGSVLTTIYVNVSISSTVIL